VPRQSDQMYNWLEQAGTLMKTEDPRPEKPADLKDLHPGDLLFWSGTYDAGRKITHVMLYLGTEKTSGEPVMFGASNGRSYKRQNMWGVSVFSFYLPEINSRGQFEGYGRIPGVELLMKDG